MNLTQNELYLLKEVFTKVKYDKMNERFYIALEDYGFLNLEGFQISLLKRMCKENDIYLEELPKRLRLVETQQLFEEYNKLKEKIKVAKNQKDKKKLESKLYEIRNSITLGHMKLVYYLINKSIPGIKDMKDKEDVYQIGYETLLEFVDLYDSNKATSFMYFVRTYIIHHIITKMYKKNKNIKEWDQDDLYKLNIARKNLEAKNQKATIENLSKITNFSEAKVKKLLQIEHFISPISLSIEENELIDELIEELIDYDFEDRSITKILNENQHLIKLVELLPEQVKKVIKLHYGLEDGTVYNQREIALKLGNISRERVRQYKEIGLTLLANSIGSNYLKDIYGETEYKHEENEYIVLGAKSNELIEELLIMQESNETLLSIINILNPTNREIMLLYYGLKDGVKHDIDEISSILNINKTIVAERKKHSTEIIIKRIAKKYNHNCKENYIELLMNNYLNKRTKKHN